MPEANRFNAKDIVVRPIGFVRSPIQQIADDCWGGVVSTIELDESSVFPGLHTRTRRIFTRRGGLLSQSDPCGRDCHRGAPSARPIGLAEDGPSRSGARSAAIGSA